MHVTYSVDWLSVTFKPHDTHPTLFMAGDWQLTGDGLHGYKQRWIDTETGAIFQCNGPRAMGSHLTLTGDTIHNMRVLGWNDKAIVDRVVIREGRASRTDLAIDIRDSPLSPKLFADDFEHGKIATRAQKGKWVDERTKKGKKRGSTFYVGNRQSDKFLRVYDKNAEQNIVDESAWVRLELELKRIKARGAVGSVSANGLNETVRGYMNDMFVWDNDDYKTALAGDSVTPPAIGKKDTKTEHWLLTIVAKTLAKQIQINPDIWYKFLEAIAENGASISHE